MSIGKIEKVDLRDVWKHEAKDFTTWLASNLEYLQDILDINLELDEVEKKLDLSNYSIDILAADDDGEAVVIENQLERSNHTHLGQILTYSVNQEAKTIIWICKEPRQEHINVINWLNEETDKQIYFLKVEAFKIGHSKPAPYFSVICAPTVEVKNIGANKKVSREKKTQRINRRKNSDCIIVPARKKGFEEVFLGENQWYAIRMREKYTEQIKYIAGYQVAPISAITYIAEVEKIVPYKDTGKYLVKFKSKAKKVNKILAGETKVQGPCYVNYADLIESKTISEAFNRAYELKKAS